MPEFITALSSKHIAVHSAAAWALHHMALHGSVIADPLATTGVLPPLLKLYTRAPDGSEAKLTAKSAVKEVIRHSSSQGPLLVLVSTTAPPELAKRALRQGLELMRTSVLDRREFVTSGSLMVMQELEPALDVQGQEYVRSINGLFPADVVAYFRNGVTESSRTESSM